MICREEPRHDQCLTMVVRNEFRATSVDGWVGAAAAVFCAILRSLSLAASTCRDALRLTIESLHDHCRDGELHMKGSLQLHNAAWAMDITR